MGWKEVEDIRAEGWKPTKAGQAIEGIYMGSEQVNGREGTFTSYRLQSKDGLVGLTGATLERRFLQIPRGASCRVVYKGEIKTSNNRKAKDFQVLVDETVDLLEADSFEYGANARPTGEVHATA